MNGASKGTSGVVDLGTIITEHQDISGKQDVLTAGDNITINNNVISAKANEPYFLGNISDYTQQNPLDIQKLHVGYQYVISTPQFGKPQLSDLWVKVVYKGEEIVQKLYVTSTDTHTHREIKIAMYKEINDDYSGYGTIFGVSYCTVNTTGTVYVDAKQTQVAFNSSDKKFYATGSGSTLYAVTSDTSQSITAKKTFTVLPESSVVPTTNNQLTNKKYVDDNKGQTIQYETMPTASADYLGKIVQYTGTTNANYTNGHFYVCVGTTENDVTTYSWSNVEVQKGTSDTAYIQREEWNNIGGVSNQGVTISDDETKRIFTKFINNIYSSDGSKCGMLELYQNYGSTSSNATSYKLTTGYVKLLNKSTNINMCPEILTFENSFKSSDTSESLNYKKYSLVIYGTWENDIFTCTKVWMSIYGITVSTITSNNLGSYALRKTNTTSYTPTGDYNPATKKYVDDSIAAAITTTLGGSF